MASASSKYFDVRSEAPEHPRIRAWRAAKTSAQRVELEIWRPRDGLTFRPARMFVTFFREGDPVGQQSEADWEIELDTWLLNEQIKAKDIDNEILRFVLRMKVAFRPIAMRFGDGLFNSVLVHLLRSAFGSREPLAHVLGEIFEYEAASGGSKTDCEQLLDYEISVAAQALLKLYGDRAVAEEILIGALAQYVDERFRVTERRQLGFG